ncbi:ABC transporter permease [Psychrosphaera sp. B3R10]|uniref:ABC transporter permease n=1 Tax=unclassified Psychrosphaera TaxID=2641570 RepID=UPI001C0874DA|nr:MULTISPECIES: ABC transporter permease [unclassified Psychrosphaera]MBU2882758.1 ABC transporter permease [Psychrosphaera sp. I2R16]MBU2989224.1 ABC transporter permease [Psychrosphaera sp. B3R10]
MFFHYIDLSWRSLKRTPLVSALMVMAIAIGIGITMTSLSVYHMMSMDPIPHKSDQLFAVQLNTTDDGNEWWTSDNVPLQLTYKDAMYLHNAETPVRKTASIRTAFTVHMNNQDVKPFLSSVRAAGQDFFTMFDQHFIYGSPWSLAQEKAADAVVVINEETNNKLFGGTNSVGKQIYLDDSIFTVVGVTKQWQIHTKYYDLNNGSFNAPEPIFIPLTLWEPMQLVSRGNTNGWKHENVTTFEGQLQSEMFWVQFWAELPTENDVKQYHDFLFSYLTEQGTKGRYTREKPEFNLQDVNEWMEYNKVVSEDNKILVGLSFMFLAVCLANILGLLLGKFIRRAPEIGVRRALGANKRQIFLQHLVEVSVLGLLGGVIGIGIAQLGLWGVRVTSSQYADLAGMDLTMVLTAPAIAIGACIIAGLYPAWLVCKTQPAIYLKTQ